MFQTISYYSSHFIRCVSIIFGMYSYGEGTRGKLRNYYKKILVTELDEGDN